MGPNRAMQYLRGFCALAVFAVVASNIWSMSRWNESRGVYDDVCYLRQAHLFQRSGLGGLDTDISRDDDQYLSAKLKEIGYPGWSDPTMAPCHVPMPATNKRVLQYPPGTGFVLALFPAGFQVIPLYVIASVVVFGVALVAIAAASTIPALVLATMFGDLAGYLMVNPAKASYSMAPTMVVCALAGLLTARLFMESRANHRVLLTLLVGLLIGLAVDFRLPNLLLSSGYLLFFLISFLSSRKAETLLQGAVFGAACLAGMAPTLLANAINAGSAFSTTYGATDATLPDFGVGIIWQYATDTQFVLLALAGATTVLILRWRRGNGIRNVALVTAGNLVVNLAFFMSHPVFTPYYTVPVAMLSLWSLLFAVLMQPGVAAEGDLLEQAAKA
jgi:hypothetical protein